MTATERLRAMLDERGVEWRKTPHYSSESTDNETVFQGYGIEWLAHDHLNGRLGLHALRYEVTPEQAIEATLGRGTCHVAYKHPDYPCSNDEVCSECGASFYFIGAANYCPNCGRRVEE